jgi:hypothetical protein
MAITVIAVVDAAVIEQDAPGVFRLGMGAQWKGTDGTVTKTGSCGAPAALTASPSQMITAIRQCVADDVLASAGWTVTPSNVVLFGAPT